MKVYVTEEQELIMEPSLKWAANPNITVVVKAYGLKATIQVWNIRSICWICNWYSLNPLLSWVEPTEICFFEIFQIVDLQVFASPRITLKPLVPTFPCFAKILVSLMEKVWQLIIRLNYSGVCVWIILVDHLFVNCDWFCSHMLTLD